MQLVHCFRTSLVFSILIALGTGCQTGKFSDAIHISSSIPGEAVFKDSVKPVLEHRCIQCHNSVNPSGGLNVQDRNSVFAENAAGPFLVPGNPEESRIWQALIRPADHPHTMPRDGWGMDIDQLEAFKGWIELGASWPKGKDGELEIKEYRVTRRDYL